MLYPLSYEGWASIRAGLDDAPTLAANRYAWRLIAAIWEGLVIQETLRAALADAGVAEGLDVPAEIGLERPANPDHGDWSSNLAMVCSKQVDGPPRDLAARLVERLGAASIGHVRGVEIAGPGFINFRLDDGWLHDVLVSVHEAGVDGYGRSAVGAGRSINVEYVSANPTGPLHAGHGRGAIYGDAVASLLEATGWDVTRETYINDRGTQMQTYADSLTARAAGEEPPEGGYMGQYIADWAAEMPADADALEWGYARALQDQREVLDALGITFDVWFSERSLVGDGAIEDALERLRAREMVYEADGAVWLRSTEFGDDKDRVLVRSNGEFTYLTPDIAYHAQKFSRSDELINVWGADHHGYIARMKAAMAALGQNPDALDVRVTQMVKLMRDGEEVKLSKRTGDIVELRDVVDEVGADATRFTYLLQSVDSQQTFDLAHAASKQMDNPVFGTQYAHARLRRIADVRAAEVGVTRGPIEDADLSLLTQARELEILRVLFDGPGMVELAAAERAPHRLVQWVRDLASAVNSWYQDDECRVISEGNSAALTQARLQLVEAARIGLAAGLGILGVGAPESMWMDEAE